MVIFSIGGVPLEVRAFFDRLKTKSIENATKCKEDGNSEFQAKKYRRAIYAYTMGLDWHCEDSLVNVQLLTNRAAAHFHLGNFRASLNDCKEAVKVKKDHFKALKRGSLCLLKLRKNDECIKWAKKALKIDSNDAELIEILGKAQKR